MADRMHKSQKHIYIMREARIKKAQRLQRNMVGADFEIYLGKIVDLDGCRHQTASQHYCLCQESTYLAEAALGF